MNGIEKLKRCINSIFYNKIFIIHILDVTLYIKDITHALYNGQTRGVDAAKMFNSAALVRLNGDAR